jgi:hypothetical protein
MVNSQLILLDKQPKPISTAKPPPLFSKIALLATKNQEMASLNQVASCAPATKQTIFPAV